MGTKIGYTESEGLLHFNLPVMLSYWLLIQKNISQAITYHKLPTLPVPTLLDCLNSNEMEKCRTYSIY